MDEYQRLCACLCVCIALHTASYTHEYERFSVSWFFHQWMEPNRIIHLFSSRTKSKCIDDWSEATEAESQTYTRTHTAQSERNKRQKQNKNVCALVSVGEEEEEASFNTKMRTDIYAMGHYATSEHMNIVRVCVDCVVFMECIDSSPSRAIHANNTEQYKH